MTRNWIEKAPRPPRFLTYVNSNAIPVQEYCILSQQPRGDAMCDDRAIADRPSTGNSPLRKPAPRPVNQRRATNPDRPSQGVVIKSTGQTAQEG
jgi:hypothetical protein